MGFMREVWEMKKIGGRLPWRLSQTREGPAIVEVKSKSFTGQDSGLAT